MKRRSVIALVAVGLAGVAAMSYVQVMGLPAAEPVLAQVPIGTPAPGFSANDVNGRPVRLANLRGKPVVLEWNNPGCPTVQEHYESGSMQSAQAAAAADGAVWLTINSSAPWKQGHMNSAQAKAYVADQKALPAAYLLDPDGLLGRAYGATATPHLYVIDPQGALAYRGALGKGDRNHVLAALSELKAGKPVSVPTTQPYGCSVKYQG